MLETECEHEISEDVGARRSLVALTEQRVPRRRLIRVLVAFAAVYLIWGSTFLGIRVAIQSIPPMLMAGTRWMIAGSCLYGFLRRRGAARPGLVLYAVYAGQRTSAFRMAAMQMLCGGAFLLMTALLRGECAHFDLAAVTLRSLLAMGYLASIGSIIGFSAYLWLLRNVEATRVATYAYVNPVVAILLGSLLGGEILAPQLLAGSLLVVLGIALIVTFRSQPIRA